MLSSNPNPAAISDEVYERLSEAIKTGLAAGRDDDVEHKNPLGSADLQLIDVPTDYIDYICTPAVGREIYDRVLQKLGEIEVTQYDVTYKFSMDFKYGTLESSGELVGRVSFTVTAKFKRQRPVVQRRKP